MKQLLQEQEFKNMVIEINNIIQVLNYKLHTIKIKDVLQRAGLPLNWNDLAKIERSNDIDEEDMEK